MSHLSDGMLRRVLDEPVAVGDAERQHAARCERCGAQLAAARADRDTVAALLDAGPADAAELDQAWSAVRHRLAAEPAAAPARGGRPVSHRGLRLRRPVVAVTAAVVLAIGTTAAAAAANWLPIFSPHTVKPVTFSVSSFASLPDLTAYGTLSTPQNWQPEVVTDAATAAARSGIAVPSIGTLPPGVTGRPAYAVLPVGHADFTFSAEKARAAAARHGEALPPMPSGIDGSTLRLDLGPGLVESWMQSQNVPTLTVVRMKAPKVSSQGVSLTTLETYLLAQPGIPAGLAAQLKALPADGSVLPIPVPSDVATSRSTTVGGVPATLLSMRDGSGGAIVWIRDGTLNAAFGLLSSSDLLSVAHELG